MHASLDAPSIDLENSTDVRPVAHVAEKLSGKRPSPATVWRWVRKGVRGGKLEAVFLRGVWQTTPAAFADFIRRQTAAALAPSAPDVDASDDALKAMGIL